MKLTSVSAKGGRIIIDTDANTRLTAEAWSDRIIRLCYTKAEDMDLTPRGDMICAAKPDIPLTAADNGREVTISAPEASVTIVKATFAVSYAVNGETVCRLAPTGIQLRDTVITTPHYIPDPDNYNALKYVSTDERPGYRFWLSLSPASGEEFYGLGQSDNGIVNRREAGMFMYQHNNTAPVPMFVSSKGYGIFVNTEAFSSFRRDQFGLTFYTDPVEIADWFFMAAEKIDDAVADFRYLTGSAPMMPKYLFGFAQSKERYCTQDELCGIVKEYRRRNVPLDLIIQDWNYWKSGMWSDKSFDESRYPDPDGMCRDIHDNHAHVMISVWPNTSGGDNYRELREKNQIAAYGSTFGGGGTYNAFDEKARETYWHQLSDGIFRHGIDAWWCDSSEPFEPSYGSMTEIDEQKEISLGVYKKWFDASRINAYSLLHSKGIYENQRKETSEKRVVNLTRSGYAGQQRYSGIVWSGDIGSSFEEMRRQIGEGLSYCVSGLPYWTLDIGGFHAWHGDNKYNAHVPPFTSTKDNGFRELYTRWIQFGAFLPVMRSHGTTLPREIWQFGDEGEMFYDSIKKFIELRYRLMPYIYSTAWQVTKNSDTFIRLLAFDFAKDAEALSHQNEEYLFGRSILVSPVTHEMYYEGADTPIENKDLTQSVYLPLGCDWYDFWTGEKHSGGQNVTVNAPIDSMPIFVKAGSIIPTGEVMQYADEKKDAPYTITVYPGRDGKFTVYEDEGDNYNYENGAYAEYDLIWSEASNKLTVSARRGSFDGMTKVRTLNITAVGGKSVSVQYSGDEISVSL